MSNTPRRKSGPLKGIQCGRCRLEPKKFRLQIPTGKFPDCLDFWDQEGIVHIDYLSKGQTFDVEYYSSLLVQMKDILKEKAAERSPSLSCSCTTIPRITGHLQPRRKWPTRESSVLITHPILRFYHLFSGLKKQLKVRHFSSDAEVIAAALTWLDGQYSEIFLRGLQKLEQRAKKSIELRGKYVE